MGSKHSGTQHVPNPACGIALYRSLMPSPPPAEQSKSKIDVAKEVVQGILDKLGPNDSVGIVLFSDQACVPKPLGPLACANTGQIKRGVSAWACGVRRRSGGTGCVWR